MSFWQLSTGKNAGDTDGTFEMSGGELEPIPNGTNVLASIEEAKWDNKDGNHYVSLRWSVLAPAEYKNRKLFQKLWIKDHDPRAKDPVKKKDTAMSMFAAIDKNAGGKIVQREEEPTDEVLTKNLCNKTMVALVMLWEMNNEQTGEKMRGNWIKKVTSRTGGEQISAANPSPKSMTATAFANIKVGKTATSPPEEDVPF